MICVCFFFMSVYSITCRNNASIINFRFGFRWKSEYPWCIIEVKNKNFPRVFKKSIFLYGLNSKTNHCKYLKFIPNAYNSVIYTQLNFKIISQNIMTFLSYL
ncbi:Uncharacterized protein FWK35_00012389 [Aphis craccivora]|uniref:Uncharacterized protein n=1 Tax=Aphis craccivora TaxID=307492 RepID=A0A6G0YVT7_APHCR|nr:Uncharacterized protein FWK35_00012389 [Aphis craccivora]